MSLDPNKKVKGTLIGVDSNAFSVMGHFSKLARRQGWTKEQIDVVLDEAKSGDYDNLLATISDRMTD